MSVQERPDELIRLLRPEFAGRSGADSPASLTWGKIMLIPPAGAPVTTYPVTVAGLLAALTAATVAGSMIWIPPGTFNTAITIPANIALVALGEKVAINGQWTLNSGNVLANIVQTQDDSSAGALSGVVGPSSGIAYMKNCSISVTNSGAGDAYAVNQSGAGELWLWGCSTYGNATGGGSGFGARQSAGTLYVTDDGRHRGSTGPFSGTVELFDPDEVIHLKTSTFTKLYNATDAGLTAALAAASSGDTVRLPDRCSISGGPWTVPAGVTVKGTYNSVLTGAITNNGICESFRVAGNVTNAGVWWRMRSSVATGSGITQSSSSAVLYRPLVQIGIGATYGINITGGYIFHGVTTNDGGSTNIGILANGATVEIYHSRFGGAAAGGQVETVKLVNNCFFAGDGDVSVNGDGLRHTTGTANISNSRFRNGGTGTGFGLNVTAAGLTLTDCNWDSVNAGGLANVTFGDGDRGAWDVVNFTAKHSKDLNDATYEHHWPLSNLDATTAPTANDDSGDGYAVGSVWVDTTNDNAYICVDASVGAAIWEQVEGGGGIEPEIAPFSLTGYDAAWSWFSDPRSVYYNGQTYFGYIASDGDVSVDSFDHSTKQTNGQVVLKAAMEVDDHDNPTLLIRDSDKKILAFYGPHTGSTIYMRISTNAEDITAFDGEVSLDASIGGNTYTYSIPIQLIGETNDPIYLIFRDHYTGLGGDAEWAFSKSTDGGASWAAKTSLYRPTTGNGYLKATRNGTDRIDFAVTDGHPQLDNNVSIYHFYYEGGNYYKSDGTLIGGAGALPLDETDLTEVYDGTTNDGWIWDIAAESDGSPVLTFVKFISTSDHRYMYAYWDGAAWNVNEITSGGGHIYGNEDQNHYSGGVVLDHNDPGIVYLSKQVGSQFEIFKYVTPDGGATWTSFTVTSGSSEKNIRPVAVYDHPPGYVALYLAGTYTTYTSYALKVVYLFDAANAAGVDEKVKVSFNDSTPGYLNGKLVAGTAITLTENNDGGNETLTIASSAADEKAKVSADDTTAGYLNGKLVAGAGIDFTENNPAGNETLTIASSYEVLMADGEATATPLANDEDTDWLYGE